MFHALASSKQQIQNTLSFSFNFFFTIINDTIKRKLTMKTKYFKNAINKPYLIKNCKVKCTTVFKSWGKLFDFQGCTLPKEWFACSINRS